MSGALDGNSGYAILGSKGGAEVSNIRYEDIVILHQVQSNVLDYDAEVHSIRLFMQKPWNEGTALFRQSNSEVAVTLEGVTVYWLGHKDEWGPLTAGGGFVLRDVIEVDNVSVRAIMQP